MWEEFIVPETAEIVTSFDHPYWKFPAITRNRYGSGTLTYEGTYLTDALQREVIREALKRADLTSADQNLPEPVKIRHGRNSKNKLLHYYLNFSASEQKPPYSYGDGADLLTNNAVKQGSSITLHPWDLVIVEERR